MSFLNLGLGELIGLLGAISAGVVALYLLDRSKRRQLVATLRFWTAFLEVRIELKWSAANFTAPWSLLTQLVSMALLLLALAGMRDGAEAKTWGGTGHVVILDTSAWMGAAGAWAAISGRR